MRRFSRQSKILEIIKQHPIETQEELTEMLRSSGFEVTQTTVSRDIKELELIKVAYTADRQRYATNNNINGSIGHINGLTGRALELFRTAIVSFDHTGVLVVIKTVAGMANAASIFVEDLGNEQVVGTVSGFNTVFVAMRDENSGKDLIKTLEHIING